jgi:hypothetical protein
MRVCHLAASAVRAVLFTVLVMLMVSPVNCLAIELTVQSDTIVRGFERDTSDGSDQAVIPGYEYLQVDMGSLTEEGLSFHLYGWGRNDFADNDFYSDNTAGELLYGYLEYTKSQNNINARLGRQYIFEGVANDAVNGLRFSSDLGDFVNVSVYGGTPVGLDSTNGSSSDSIYGGRIALHRGMHGEIGLSYKKSENDGDKATEMAGIDASAYLPWGIAFYGKSVRNMETDGWAEHAYELDFGYEAFRFRPYFSMFKYEDYFDTGANAVNPFRNLITSGEEINLYGFDVTWLQSASWTFGAKYKYYDYDIADANSSYSVLATWHGEGLTEVGGELGYVDGDRSEDTYTLARVYGYRGGLSDVIWVDFATADVVYASYDEDIYNQDYSFFSSLGTGKNFMDGALTVKLSGDYSVDPYFDDDLRGMLSLTYKFDHGL